MDIFEEILKWPIIVQGALGSALFWLVLLLGQKSTNFLASKVSSDKQVATFFCHLAKSAPNQDQKVRGFFYCLYGAFHYFLKAFIVIVLALLISPYNHVASIAGYLISLYFLFRSLSYVQHFSSLGSNEDSIRYLKSAHEKHGKEPASKSLQPTAEASAD